MYKKHVLKNSQNVHLFRSYYGLEMKDYKIKKRSITHPGHWPTKLLYLVIKADKNEERCNPCGSEGVEGLEEEDELEVLGNLLESKTNW